MTQLAKMVLIYIAQVFYRATLTERLASFARLRYFVPIFAQGETGCLHLLKKTQSAWIVKQYSKIPKVTLCGYKIALKKKVHYCKLLLIFVFL